MHELSVAKRLVDRAIEAARDHDAGRVRSLTVELGEATHLTTENLSRCLDAVAADTRAEGAAISFERVRPRGRCDCGWSGSPDSIDGVAGLVPDLRCPDCGSAIELTAGRECRLASIDVPDTTDTHQ